MEKWKKLVLLIIIIISVILAISRYYVVKNNFIYSIGNTSVQNTNQHILKKYLLESKMVETLQEGKQVTDDVLVEYAKSLVDYTNNYNEAVALYTEHNELLYSDFEKINKLDVRKILSDTSDNYSMNEIEGRHYMLFNTHWAIDGKTIYLVNIFDVENIYDERDRQIKDILFRDIIIIIVSFCTISLFAKIVTNHIHKKDEFITGFTHELKTPMTAIMGYSDMLRLKKCNEEVSSKALNYIYTEAKRLENLSLKLMKLMSITDGTIKLKSVEIKNVISKFLNTQEFSSDTKIEIELEEYNVLADIDLLEVVIRNLIENAIKSDPKDNKVLIKGEILENKKYRILVIDKGKGIPKEHIKKVTESFYMVDKSRNRANGGNGIGLALVCKILKLHKSKLIIESKENIGTTVYFDLKEAKK